MAQSSFIVIAKAPCTGATIRLSTQKVVTDQHLDIQERTTRLLKEVVIQHIIRQLKQGTLSLGSNRRVLQAIIMAVKVLTRCTAAPQDIDYSPNDVEGFVFVKARRLGNAYVPTYRVATAEATILFEHDSRYSVAPCSALLTTGVETCRAPLHLRLWLGS